MRQPTNEYSVTSSAPHASSGVCRLARHCPHGFLEGTRIFVGTEISQPPDAMYLMGRIPYQSLLPPLHRPNLLHVLFWVALHFLVILLILQSSYFVTSRGPVKNTFSGGGYWHPLNYGLLGFPLLPPNSSFHPHDLS